MWYDVAQYCGWGSVSEVVVGWYYGVGQFEWESHHQVEGVVWVGDAGLGGKLRVGWVGIMGWCSVGE